MPKINVYLPDDLAEAVKDIGVPVSAICQRALELAVKRVSAIRAAVTGDLTGADPTAGLTQFTQRSRDVIKLAIANARERGAAEIGTRDLLLGMVTEGANMALLVLPSIEVDPATVLRELGRVESPDEGGSADRMSRTAAGALELTVTEAISLGHNYVGCEHLLLGLVAEPAGAAGQVLRGLGVELRGARHAVRAALAGYVHLRDHQAAQAGTAPMANVVVAAVDAAVDTALQPVLNRLDRLEEKVG
ncbi:MAG: ATP-dependent Clp protease ATP-binding subunit [Actinophytocola sp.]|uniref:Clp protease N-terminal domain-containing protein n=1 Tax=Actinophytocola sp. TaxID=1872138 RepID=UPI0013293148|nr:Clp protease N-terminal domain-containing protein [Actinophytocola sp.]MPZ79873.1 ATP-dependent Clp protease ATP-binding subunit [Actinophytocola sp.]